MAISNISDTARWVAAFRARESERPDALFRDPFARQLAGARGFELAQQLRGAVQLAWTMAVRTRVLDEMLLEAVHREAVDAVVNLAAGLDTRPLRLQLPRELTWVEADLPGIFDHKEEVLGGAPASCRLERVRVDLADDGARRELLARIGRDFRRAVVLTEGLLVYLPEPAVANLARELHAQPGVAHWMMDLVGDRSLHAVKLLWNSDLAQGNARMQFGPKGGARWFEQFGWRVHREALFADEGARLRRGVANQLWGRVNRFVPQPLRRVLLDGTGLAWLAR